MVRGQAKAESRIVDNSSLAARKRKPKPKKEKKAKDPNKPKRPASAFLVFMEEFRKTFKEENPGNKSVAVVGKAGGDKWKSLTAEEKAPYMAIAETRKRDYDRKMQAYTKKLEGGANSDESEKSKSEVHDDEDGSGEEEEDDD